MANDYYMLGNQRISQVKKGEVCLVMCKYMSECYLLEPFANTFNVHLLNTYTLTLQWCWAYFLSS